MFANIGMFEVKKFIAITSAVICVISVVILLLTSPERTHKATVSLPTRFLIPTVQLSNVSVVSSNIHFDVTINEPLCHPVTFQPRFDKTVRGNCEANGLRRDFCLGSGKLDFDPNLFEELSSCNNVEHSSFIGGCRVNDEQVLDYCITTKDVNWTWCIQQETNCLITPYNHSTVVVEKANLTSLIVSIPVDIYFNNSVSIHISLLYFTASTGSPYSDAAIRVFGLNELFVLRGTEYKGVAVKHGGSTPVDLRFSVNSSLPNFHINSIELYIAGAATSVTISVLSVGKSSCIYNDATLVAPPPLCYMFSPTRIQSAVANLTQKTRGVHQTTIAHTSLNSTLPYALQSSFAYFLLYFDINVEDRSIASYPVPTDFTSPLNTTYDQEYITYNISLLYFILNGKYQDTVTDVRKIEPILVDKATFSELVIAMHTNASGVITVYGLNSPECLFRNSANQTSIFTLTKKDAAIFTIPLSYSQAIDTCALQTFYGQVNDGLQRFGCKSSFSIDTSYLNVTNMRCTYTYSVIYDLRLYNIYTALVDNNTTTFNLDTPITLRQTHTSMNLFIGSDGDRFTVFGAGDTKSVSIDTLVCSQQSTSINDTALLNIRRFLYPSSAAYIQTTGFLEQTDFSFSTKQADWENSESYNVKFVEIPFYQCTAGTYDSTCATAETSCIIPYKCLSSLAPGTRQAVFLKFTDTSFYTYPVMLGITNKTIVQGATINTQTVSQSFPSRVGGSHFIPYTLDHGDQGFVCSGKGCDGDGYVLDASLGYSPPLSGYDSVVVISTNYSDQLSGYIFGQDIDFTKGSLRMFTKIYNNLFFTHPTFVEMPSYVSGAEITYALTGYTPLSPETKINFIISFTNGKYDYSNFHSKAKYCLMGIFSPITLASNLQEWVYRDCMGFSVQESFREPMGLVVVGYPGATPNPHV